MRGWWSNGISMKEWLAFVLICIYSTTALIIATKLYKKGIASVDVDFFWTLSWPVMVIVGFYFTEKIAANFGKSPRVFKEKEPEKPVVERDDESGTI